MNGGRFAIVAYTPMVANGYQGEATDVISADNLSSVEWLSAYLIAQKQRSLTRHKATFNAPMGDEP